MDLIYNTFQAGELSPKMKGRSDILPYHQGCKTVENFVVEPTGGADRRPGFEHIDAAYSHSYASRLIGFVNGADRYVLEFSNLKMRVFHDGEAVQSTGVDYELVTPWTAAELSALVFATRGQAIFHPDHDIYELACDGDASWTLTAFASTYGPFLDENETPTKTITPSGTTGNITLTAAGHTPFVTGASGHVGALVKLTHEISEAATAGTLYNTGNSAEVTISGEWALKLSGRWAGNVKWQRSEDGATTWKDVRNYYRKTPSSSTIVDKGEETEEGVVYRLNVTWIGTPDPADTFLEKFFNAFYDSLHYEIKAAHAWQTGIARITAVTSTILASATVLVALGGTTATYRWAEGAFSPYQGYPACGTIHENRVIAAATTKKPTGVWAGKTFKRRKDSRLFDTGNTVEADDAWSRTIDVPDCNQIRWLESLWVLLVGSDSSLVKGTGPSENQPMTPTDASFVSQSGMGASALQPVRVAGFLVYAGRDAKRVYEMTYSDDARVYQPEDLTFFADHIAGSGIAGWAFQQQPLPILWAVTADGELIGLTRDREKQITAWHRHIVGGDGIAESLCVVPGDTEDEVWVSVRRTINGSTYRSIERMKSLSHWTAQRDCFYVDGGTTWDGGAAVTITGISVDPATNRVTVTAAGMTDGWTVRPADVVGMTDVNGHVYTVADATATDFVLKTRDGTAYIDGSAFAAYLSGGTVERVANSVSGLTHLAGAPVVSLLDGQPATGTVSSAGVYTIGTGKDRYYKNTITVGHDYDYTLEPMPPEVRTVAGSVQGKKKRITHIGVRVYQSAGGRIGSSVADAQNIDYRLPGHITGSDVVLADGDWQQDYPGGWTADGSIVVTGNGPLPMTITAILFGMET